MPCHRLASVDDALPSPPLFFFFFLSFFSTVSCLECGTDRSRLQIPPPSYIRQRHLPAPCILPPLQMPGLGSFACGQATDSWSPAGHPTNCPPLPSLPMMEMAGPGPIIFFFYGGIPLVTLPRSCYFVLGHSLTLAYLFLAPEPNRTCDACAAIWSRSHWTKCSQPVACDHRGTLHYLKKSHQKNQQQQNPCPLLDLTSRANQV
jgi:hypothetical protein